MNVVGYCRYSSEKQKDGYSIEAQKKAIMDYCSKNKYKLLRFYIDEAISGTTDDREQFKNMVDDSKQGTFEAVIVHKYDRFGRNRDNSALYRVKLKENGVRIISVLERINDDAPEDVLLLSVIEGINEFYSKNLSREVRKGMNEAASNGFFCGGVAPFGYRPDSKTKKLVVVPEEASIVRDIFTLFSEGYQLSTIARKLKEKGILTRNGACFGPSSLKKIVENEVYVGTLVFNSYKNRKVPKNAPKEIRTKNAHEAIISQELFNKCKANFASASAVRPKYCNDHSYLLTGYCDCAICGKHYTGVSTVKYNRDKTSKKKYFYYECRGKKSWDVKCKSKKYSQEELENAVLEAFYTIFDKDFVKRFAPLIEANLRGNVDVSKIKILETSIANAKKKLARLLDVYLDGDLEKNDFVSKKRSVEAQIAEMEIELNNLKSVHQYSLEEIETALELFVADIENIDKELLIKLFMKKILIYQDSIEICVAIPSGSHNSSNGEPLGTLYATFNMQDVRKTLDIRI